ncbi:HAD hydrolase-like protein [Candidatus Falkowbacteria bacterium]|nr:HAD hydrolase-like protein [Candidatus Falkowbacteria bacterium]NCT54751.1 HAD hydrolase-like protein [Candidatus Falkowbacteria bacterium]
MKTILVDAVNTFIIKDLGIFQEMQSLLESYSNRKIIVTNANDEQIIKFGLDKVPYEVFTMKHEPEKTDPNYFQILMKHYNLRSEEVIYFEHNKDAVESAKSLGINTFYYDPERRDLGALKVFLDSSINN